MIFAKTRIIFTGLELRALLTYSSGAAPAHDGICIDVEGRSTWAGDGSKSLACIGDGPRSSQRRPALRVSREVAKAASHFDAASFALHNGSPHLLLWRGFVDAEAKALAVRPEDAKAIAIGNAECQETASLLEVDERSLAHTCTIDPRALQPIGIMRTLGIREVQIFMHSEGNPLSARGKADGCTWIAECSVPKAKPRKR